MRGVDDGKHVMNALKFNYPDRDKKGLTVLGIDCSSVS